MHPELFTLPGGMSIQTYGFFLMIGFLTAVWFAMRRASRVKADPDVVLDLSFWALICGVAGARLFYVIHYWQNQFAHEESIFWAIVDIRKGGLEFLGGLLGGMGISLFILWKKKLSIRLYGDIIAPSVAWGLGVGRIGCFFNGCCFGAIAVAPGTEQAAYPWAMKFPYGSPPHNHQWEARKLTVPAELINTLPGAMFANLVPAADLALPVEKLAGPLRQYAELKEKYDAALAKSPSDPATTALKSKVDAAKKVADQHQSDHLLLFAAQKYPSRMVPGRVTSVSELQDLAAKCSSLPIHPVQLYAAGSAMLLSFFLSSVFYRRKRHGVVFGLLLLLSPISRVLEEMIRTDNPHDTFGLSVSQFISLGMFTAGLIFLHVIYRKMPERAPGLVAVTAA